MLRKILLACGIVSSIWYIVVDVLGSLRYPGYSFADQEFSELTAAGAPTRPFMVALTEFPYSLLVLAFAVGLWTSTGVKRRAARITGSGLVGFLVFGFVAGTITPMATREIAAAGEATLRNAFHGPLTLVSDLFLIAAMAFAAQLLGKRFRYYTYASIVVLLVFGIWTSFQIPQLAANEPTPWMGLKERTNIYATMLWMAVLAAGLLRAQGNGAANAEK
jgi:hypothetical protein